MGIVSTILLILFLILVITTWLRTGKNVWEIAWAYIAVIIVVGVEGVMNFSPTLALRDGYSKTIPKRRFRRRVGIRGPVPRPPPGGCSTARSRSARGSQRVEAGDEDRLAVVLHAPRPFDEMVDKGVVTTEPVRVIFSRPAPL